MKNRGSRDRGRAVRQLPALPSDAAPPSAARQQAQPSELRHQDRQELHLPQPAARSGKRHAGKGQEAIGGHHLGKACRIVGRRVGECEGREGKEQHRRRPDPGPARQGQKRASGQHGERPHGPSPGRNPSPHVEQISLNHRRRHPEGDPEAQDKRILQRVARAGQPADDAAAQQQEDREAGDRSKLCRRGDPADAAARQQGGGRTRRQEPQQHDAERDRGDPDGHVGAGRQQGDEALAGGMGTGTGWNQHA